MRIASVAEIKARLSLYLKEAAAGPVVVTRNGKAVAVLLGVEDDDEVERLLLTHSRKLRAILDAADRRIDKGAGVGHEEFWQQVESAAGAREENGSGQKARRKKRKAAEDKPKTKRVGNRTGTQEAEQTASADRPRE